MLGKRDSAKNFKGNLLFTYHAYFLDQFKEKLPIECPTVIAALQDVTQLPKLVQMLTFLCAVQQSASLSSECEDAPVDFINTPVIIFRAHCLLLI